MTAERRESMLTAVESSHGFDNLRALVKRYLDEDIRAEQLLEDLSQIRALVSDEIEEMVLDVMDLLVGWCAPEFRLVHEQKSELGLLSLVDQWQWPARRYSCRRRLDPRGTVDEPYRILEDEEHGGRPVERPRDNSRAR